MAPVAFAAQSLVLTPGTIGSFSLPNTSAFRQPNSLRLETRIHSWSLSPSASQPATPLFVLEGMMTIALQPSHFLVLTEWMDAFTSGQGNGFVLDIAGRDDFILRVQRDTSQKVLQVELWNVDGSNYFTRSIPIDQIVSKTLAGAHGVIGGATTSASLAYLRLSSTLLAAGKPPSLTAQSTDVALLDLEFERNNTDDSPSHVSLSVSSSYAASPVYPPSCNAGAMRSVKMGLPATLDGTASYSLDGSLQLNYNWSVVRAPEPIQWMGGSAGSVATFQPGTFGTYIFKLTVTDSSLQSASCTATYGAVSADDNDIVLLSDANLNQVFSPMLRLGASPWPWYDDRHKTLADFFGGLQSTEDLEPWNNPAAGTLSATKDSRIVTGQGTTFIQDFCGGKALGDGSALVVWYPIAGSPDHTGRRAYDITSCDSDTQVTLAQPYAGTEPAGGLTYSHMNPQEVFTWGGGATNANFYDNVLAFYALYYRSGVDTYLNYARTLADRWWAMPYVDEGRTCSLEGGPCMWPRNRSLMGLIVRALDGRPDMWPGIQHWCESDSYFLRQPGPPGDIREQAYQLNEVSLCAMFHPDATERDIFGKAVLSALDGVWAPFQQPAGHWLNPTYGYAPWNGYSGSATVSAGSTMVEGVGTTWTSDYFPTDNVFWISNGPNDALHGDPVSYGATLVDPSHLKLDRPYVGASGANRGWQSNNLVGPGTQPFTLGVLGNAMQFAYVATGDPRARRYVIDIANWIKDFGYRSSVRGLYYGRYYPNCEPIQEGIKNCSQDNLVAARAYASEVIATFSRAYMLTGDPQLRDMGDNLFGAIFGKAGFGGPQSDGLFDNEIDDGGWTMQTHKAKDFGFLFGFSQGWTWPAARLQQGPAPVVHRKR
jgi:hypothetical protein